MTTQPTRTLMGVALEWLSLFQRYAEALSERQPTEIRLENLRRLRAAMCSPELQAAIDDIRQEIDAEAVTQ